MKSLYYLPLAFLLILYTTITNVIATPIHSSQQSARYHVETIINGLTKKWTTFRDFERYCLPSNTGRQDTTLSVVCKTLMDLFGGYKHLLSSRSGFNACSDSSCDTQSCEMSIWLNIAGIERLEEPGWYASRKLGVFMKAAINTLVEQNSDEELRKFIGELNELHQEIRVNKHAFVKRDDVPGEASTSNDNREESHLQRTNSSISSASAYSSAIDGEIMEEEEDNASNLVLPTSSDAASTADSSFESTTSNIEHELIETFTESIQVFLDHQFESNNTELVLESVRVIESPDGDLLVAFKLSEDGITRVYSPPPVEQMRFEVEQEQERVPSPIHHNVILDLVDKIADKYFGLFNRCGYSDSTIAVATGWVASVIILCSTLGGILHLLDVFQIMIVNEALTCFTTGGCACITGTGFGCMGVGSCCCSLAARRERNLWEERMRARNDSQPAAEETIENDNSNNNSATVTLEEAVNNINVLDSI